jgi:HK97 family phage portal protein
VSVWRRSARPATSARSSFPEMPFASAAAQIAATYADGAPADMEGQMQVIAVRSAVDLIASLASELPFGVYSGEPGSRTKHRTPGNLEDPAGDGHGVEDWAYQVVESFLMRGNLYGNILARGPRDRLDQLALYHPDRVGGWVDPQTGAVQWTVEGARVEQLDRFLHRRVNPVPGNVLGLSPIQRAMTEVGMSITTQRFGVQWFTDGAHPDGILINTEKDLDKPQADTAKARFLAALRGRREPLVLGRGWKFEKIQVAPEESQFLESRNYSAVECCRIFGPSVAELLGYETKQSMTYANRVDRAQDFLTLSLNRWLNRLERLYNMFLPDSRYAIIDRDEILVMSLLDRYKAYEIGIKNQFLVPNEPRAKENYKALPGGDVPVKQPAKIAPKPAEDGEDEG